MGFESIVLFNGVLEGAGRQANCAILACKVRDDSGTVVGYTHLSVIGAPHDMPDGEYAVHFEGQTTEVVRQRGFWFPAHRSAKAR